MSHQQQADTHEQWFFRRTINNNNNEKSKNQTNIHKNENASQRIKFLLHLG